MNKNSDVFSIYTANYCDIFKERIKRCAGPSGRAV